MKDLIAKLNPNRFPGMSPKMAAIVGYILGQEWTNPYITELQVTSDNFVLSGINTDPLLNRIEGRLDELQDNWNRLLAVAGLTNAEMQTANGLFAAKIGRAA